MSCGFQISEFRLRNERSTGCAPSGNPQSAIRNPHSKFRQGISLIEVLISMFVLLFGLMGVAAIFPVGNHYVVEGEKFDLGAALAQNAFEELKGRGMLKPELWHYADPQFDLRNFNQTNDNPPVEYETQVIQPPVLGAALNLNSGQFNIAAGAGAGPGHAFVIDPIGATTDRTLQHVDVFPRQTDADGDVRRANPWHPRQKFVPQAGSRRELTGARWPVRRITVLDAQSLMQTSVAETIFRLRDDLAVEQPDKSDVPSIQRWDLADVRPDGITPNNTLEDFRDDQLLRRQYKGDYSWLATIVPTTDTARLALQPASEDYGQIACDVSVVVFRKREFTPTGASERLVKGELLLGGELIIYSDEGDANDAKEIVDEAVDEIRPGNWISIMGVNQTTGDFVMKWYRLLALDDETIDTIQLSNGGTVVGRRAMLTGPDWPAVTDGAGGILLYVPDLRVGLFPGAISVVTKPLRMESSSLWDVE